MLSDMCCLRVVYLGCSGGWMLMVVFVIVVVFVFVSVAGLGWCLCLSVIWVVLYDSLRL